MTRPYTDRLLEMIEDGMLDRDTVIMACVKYMSEQDVQDMMEINEFILEPNDLKFTNAGEYMSEPQGKPKKIVREEVKDRHTSHWDLDLMSRAELEAYMRQEK